MEEINTLLLPHYPLCILRLGLARQAATSSGAAEEFCFPLSRTHVQDGTPGWVVSKSLTVPIVLLPRREGSVRIFHLGVKQM